MNNFISRPFIRCSVQELKGQKCNLHINRNSQQMRPVLSCVSSLSQQTKYFSLTSCSSFENSSKKPVIKFPGKSRFHSYCSHLELRNGIINTNGLFKNSYLHLPTKSNIRYESTSSAFVSDTPESEIPESQSWLDIHKEGFEFVLKDMGESPLASGFQTMIEQVHIFTDLPWWATIILSAVAVKTLFLPLSIKQRQVLAKLENIQQDNNDIMDNVKHEITLAVKKFGWPVEFAKDKYREILKEEIRNSVRREKAHPLTPCTVVALQSTIWMTANLAIGNMCCAFPHNDIAKEHLYSEMTTGGLAWITNLTVPDGFLMLPLSIGLLNLCIVALHRKSSTDPSIVQKVIYGFFSLLSLGMVPLAMQLPSGLVLYWVASSGYGLLFNLMFSVPKVKKVLQIQELKSDIQRKEEVKKRMSDIQDRIFIGKPLAKSVKEV